MSEKALGSIPSSTKERMEEGKKEGRKGGREGRRKEGGKTITIYIV